MDILEKARKLESGIARTLDHAAQRVLQSGPSEPLEIAHAIVESVAKEVQPGGRGRRVFPFNSIKILVVADSRHPRAHLEAVFESQPSLRERILERLRAAGCHVSDLTVTSIYVSQAASHWTRPEFHLEFARVAPVVEVIHPRSPTPANIGLTVVHGSADQPTYSFNRARIDLGRCTEVRDRTNRLIRTNHVAFSDSAGDLNQSVSRQHAHIEYSEGADQFRLYDDRSTHGTGVLRNGRTIAVPPGSRGVRLQAGDEIVLGEAKLRVRLGAV